MVVTGGLCLIWWLNSGYSGEWWMITSILMVLVWTTTTKTSNIQDVFVGWALLCSLWNWMLVDKYNLSTAFPWTGYWQLVTYHVLPLHKDSPGYNGTAPNPSSASVIYPPVLEPYITHCNWWICVSELDNYKWIMIKCVDCNNLIYHTNQFVQSKSWLKYGR